MFVWLFRRHHVLVTKDRLQHAATSGRASRDCVLHTLGQHAPVREKHAHTQSVCVCVRQKTTRQLSRTGIRWACFQLTNRQDRRSCGRATSGTTTGCAKKPRPARRDVRASSLRPRVQLANTFASTSRRQKAHPTRIVAQIANVVQSRNVRSEPLNRHETRRRNINALKRAQRVSTS